MVSYGLPFAKTLDPLHLFGIVVGDTHTFTTITSSTPSLLVVTFETFRHVEVNDIANVWLVYAHAEGDCRHDDLYALLDEGILVLGSLLRI